MGTNLAASIIFCSHAAEAGSIRAVDVWARQHFDELPLCCEGFQESTALLDHLREGDVVVVWKLDRLSRSLKDLLHILEKTEAAGANFRSLTEAIDTSGPAGRMMMQMLGSFAEFERAMVRERTRAGLKAAREQGRKGGRRPKLMAHQKTEILAMLAAGRAGAEIARVFRVHRATISRIATAARTVSPKTGAAPDPLAAQVAAAPLASKI